MSDRTKKVARAGAVGAFALMLALAGCSGSSSTSGSSDDSYVSEDLPDISSESKSQSQSYSSNSSSGSKGVDTSGGFSAEDMLGDAAAEGAFDVSTVGDTNYMSLGASDSEESAEQAVDERDDIQNMDRSELEGAMIRKEADVQLTSKDFKRASDTLTGIVRKYAVVTLRDNTDTDTYYSGGSHCSRYITIRVKNEQFDEVCDAISGESDETWKVESLEKSAEDVTKQYSETEKQIEGQRARYEWYKRELENTTDPNLVKTYSDSMFEALDKMTMLENQNSDLKTDADYSLISVSLYEDAKVEEVRETSGGVWDDLGEEIAALPDRLSGAFGLFLLGIVRFLPTLLILAIIALIVFLVARPLAKRSKKAREERLAQMQARQAQMMANRPMGPQPNGPQPPQGGAPVPPAPPVTAPAPVPVAIPEQEETATEDAVSKDVSEGDAFDDEPSFEAAPVFSPVGEEAEEADADAPEVEPVFEAAEETTNDGDAEPEFGMPMFMNAEPDLPVAHYEPVGDGDETVETAPADPELGDSVFDFAVDMDDFGKSFDDADDGEKVDVFDDDGDEFGSIDDLFDKE